MKNIKLWKAFLFIMAVIAAFTSCKESADVGMELLPSSDLIVVRNATMKDEIRAYTFTDDSVRSDESANSLLGSFHDPVFGKTTIDLAMQLRLASFPSFGINAIADSVIFYFYYRTIYGDTSTVQRLHVYELNQAIDPDENYYGHDDVSRFASTNPLGSYDFKPKVLLDSVYKDTLYQLVGIKLDHSLAQKLISADSTDMINNEAFLNYFKGLYIKPEPVQNGGAIVSLDLIPTSSFQGSALILHYHNAADTLTKAYYITNFSARVNGYRHDYSQSAFYQNLNKETIEDSLIYIQSTGGLKSKLYIPGLENWKDSANIAINKAELIFPVDTTLSEYRKYPLPNQLFLTYINENGRERLPRDHSFYSRYYGGFLQTDLSYRFNITQHMQAIIDGEVENNGFYLTPVYKNNEMRRAVLKGSSSKHGIRLIVTYSKLLQ